MQCHSAAPTVCFEAIIVFPSIAHDFWTTVFRRTNTASAFAGILGAAQSKVYELDIALFIDQNVLQLDIAMGNSDLMAILDSLQNLLKNDSSFGLSHWSVISLSHELH